MNTKKLFKNIGMTLVIPVAVYLFFMIITNLFGEAGFGVGSNLENIIYSSCYTGLIALAMSMNLSSGRFDFSVGATLVLAVILGGNITLDLGLNWVGFLLVTALIGGIIGAVSGITYVTLGLPPMVVSLGLAMVYEAIGFIFNDAKGVRMIGKMKLLVFSSFPNNVILLAVVLAILVILVDFTSFGYHRKSLANGQKISVDVGINEKLNAVACYVIAGVLLGIAGCMFISKNGMVTPETSLGSSAYFMNAFLPIFIGGAIAKYSSHPIGVFVGAITQSFIIYGFEKMGMSSSMQTVMNGIIVCAFLIYTSNSYKLVEAKMFKAKLEQAKAARAAQAE